MVDRLNPQINQPTSHTIDHKRRAITGVHTAHGILVKKCFDYPLILAHQGGQFFITRNPSTRL